MTQPDILADYDRLVPALSAFTVKVRGLIEDLLQPEASRIHTVTCRVKARDSLERKLARPDKSYQALFDVTDLCGVRITTYFADDVDVVARVLESDFAVDAANTLDKRAALDPDRFGYLSLHHVVRLSPERATLKEYKPFAEFPIEVQTRSILQHAWAEIEHDLGYKSSREVPKTIRRRFSRLAGLLELADQEFLAIRGELEAYAGALPEQIAMSPASVPLDKASLTSFAQSSLIVRSLDQRIADVKDARLGELSPGLISMSLVRLEELGLETIEQVDRGINRYADDVVALADVFIPDQPPRGVRPEDRQLAGGTGLFYLCYVLALESTDEGAVDRIARLVDGRNPERFVARLRKGYAKARERGSRD